MDTHTAPRGWLACVCTVPVPVPVMCVHLAGVLGEQLLIHAPYRVAGTWLAFCASSWFLSICSTDGIRVSYLPCCVYRAGVSAYVRACGRKCVRVCVRACVRACAQTEHWLVCIHATAYRCAHPITHAVTYSFAQAPTHAPWHNTLGQVRERDSELDVELAPLCGQALVLKEWTDGRMDE
jgi:hypothetical protein